MKKDVIHKATHDLVSDPDRSLFVVEDLKVNSMTKRPAPKQDASSRYIRNGARAKAGLNRAILSSCRGLFVVLLSYKARRAGKFFLKIDPHYSSQECARCGHIHPDNRPSQAEFVCQRCGFKDNADHNASLVMAKRGIRLLLEGKVRQKTIRRCGIGKLKTLGPERSEVKASGEDDKTRRSKRLRAASAKEELPLARSETPPTAQSAQEGESSCRHMMGRPRPMMVGRFAMFTPFKHDEPEPNRNKGPELSALVRPIEKKPASGLDSKVQS